MTVNGTAGRSTDEADHQKLHGTLLSMRGKSY